MVAGKGLQGVILRLPLVDNVYAHRSGRICFIPSYIYGETGSIPDFDFRRGIIRGSLCGSDTEAHKQQDKNDTWGDDGYKYVQV